MKNRALSSTVSIAVAILLSLTSFALPKSAFTTQTVDEMTNVTSDSQATLAQSSLDGSGTEEDPYVIDTPSAFLDAAGLINNNANKETYGKAVYSIASCLDFDGLEFVPWGTSGAPFNGTLYGNGHKLYNIAVSDTYYFGVVGYMENGKVNGVHAEYKEGTYSVRNMSSFGGIAAYIYPSQASPDAAVTECSSKGKVTIQASQAFSAGGICGYVYNKSKAGIYVSDCVSYLDMTVNAGYTVNAGGISGHFTAVSSSSYNVSKCVSYTDVSVTSNSGYVGGFVGYTNAEQAGWSDWVSFLASETQHYNGCVSFGDVTTNADHVGKFAGYPGDDNNVVAKNCCYSSSAVLTATVGMVESMGTSCSEENLKSQSYMSSTLGFDFTDTWTMSDDGIMTLKNECADCVTEPYFVLTQSGAEVNGYTGELAVSVFKDKMLDKVVFVPVTGFYSATFEQLGLTVDDGDTVKAFLFEEKSTFKPLTQGQTLVVEAQ